MSQRLAALDFIAACLSIRGTLDVDANLHSTIMSGCLDWRIVLDITNNQKIAPDFWAALRKRKLAEYLPSEMRACFFKLHLFKILKNKCFKEQAIEVVRQLNSIGVEPILLKGSASLFVKTFDDLGSRVMMDLDILVPQQSAEDCWNALHALGYTPIEDNHDFFDYNRHHHLRPLYHPGKQGTIEIHRAALPSSAARILPTKLIWKQAEPIINQFGIVMSAPSPTHRILHNILHADLINQTYARGTIALRSLHEIAMMQVYFNERIDWESLWRVMDLHGQVKILHASLYLAHRLFGSPMPDRIHPTVGAIAHYARTRLQVRWNWINALVERVFWFSAQNICEHYNCDHNFWSVTKGRIHLATHLSLKYGGRALHLIGCQIRRGRVSI